MILSRNKLEVIRREQSRSKVVAVVTMPLYDNHGGILQCFALVRYLSDQGFYPVVLDKFQFYSGWRFFVYRILRVIPFQNVRGIRSRYVKSKVQRKLIARYIRTTDRIHSKHEVAAYYDALDPFAVVVGSDQVWRFSYIDDGYWDFYFLTFVTNAKKIAYAASFGTASWEAPNLRKLAKKYLSDFEAVSTREESGVVICNDYFDLQDAAHVVDPTLFYDKKYYERVFNLDEACLGGGVVTYILDLTPLKKKLVAEVSVDMGMSVNDLHSGSKRKALSFIDWVSAISKADFVLTDSFHGMVFSIIFQKQFYAIINEGRGADRFVSLAKKLGLEDRLLFDNAGINVERKIEYESVLIKLDEHVAFSKNFLLRALGSD